MTLDHLREIALIQISQAQRTNAMNITAHKSGSFTDFNGTDAEVSKVADIIGKSYSPEKRGLRACVTLGAYPDQVAASVAKLKAAGITVTLPE